MSCVTRRFSKGAPFKSLSTSARHCSLVGVVKSVSMRSSCDMAYSCSGPNDLECRGALGASGETDPVGGPCQQMPARGHTGLQADLASGHDVPNSASHVQWSWRAFAFPVQRRQTCLVFARRSLWTQSMRVNPGKYLRARSTLTHCVWTTANLPATRKGFVSTSDCNALQNWALR